MTDPMNIQFDEEFPVSGIYAGFVDRNEQCSFCQRNVWNRNGKNFELGGKYYCFYHATHEI